MQYADLPPLQQILPGIASRADRYDQTGEWPDEDLHELATIGAMRWAVPLEFAGEDLSPLELHLRYEAIASASLATALILSQRDAAIRILAAAKNPPADLLHALANNEIFTTVGIAQLTTSRQRGAPSLRATAHGNDFEIDGEIPWASGADHSNFLVVGAAFENGEQILFTLDPKIPGVHVEKPLPLAALSASHTGSVICERVKISASEIMFGPAKNVMAARGAVLPIPQAFLATGLTAAAINLIRQIQSPAADDAAAALNSQLQSLRSAVLDYCNPTTLPDAKLGATLRGRCIDLALRATHAAVSLHKGAALLLGHPAQRLARESLFLLVWSCPSPVVECTLELLLEEKRRTDE